MRQVKVKALRKIYAAWVAGIKDSVPQGMRPISFRSWRKRVL